MGLVIVISLQCDQENTSWSKISFAIEMVPQAELILVLVDALRVMKGSEQSLSPKMLIVLLCTGFSFLTSEIIESVLLWSVGLSQVEIYQVVFSYISCVVLWLTYCALTWILYTIAEL